MLITLKVNDVFSNLAAKAEEAPPAEETDEKPVKRAADEEVGVQLNHLFFHTCCLIS